MIGMRELTYHPIKEYVLGKLEETGMHKEANLLVKALENRAKTDRILEILLEEVGRGEIS